MYKLPTHVLKYDRKFLKSFRIRKGITNYLEMEDLIKWWWVNDDVLKNKANNLYTIEHMKGGPITIATVIYGLHGKHNSFLFKTEWVPLVHQEM